MGSSDELLDQILDEAPSSSTILLLLERHRAEGRLEKVIRGCIGALDRYPHDPRIRALLAEACLELGWLSRAEAEVETAEACLEELVHIYKLKAKICSRMNRRDEAARCLEIYLAHRPEDQESLALLQALTPLPETPSTQTARAERPPEARQETPPFGQEIATPTLAEVYFAQGQVEEAISTYEKVISRNPGAEQPRVRLEELKAMAPAAPPATEDDAPIRLRKKKERLIHLLETWRDSIRSPQEAGGDHPPEKNTA